MKYLPTIGLEIHIELKTRSKMFCSSLNDPSERHPNINVCPVCMGHPGTLPVINEEAIKKTIKTGLALNCKIPEDSKFDRKNYFYPDLPKGYQISQYDKPLCKGGFLNIGGNKISITRVHLEEDTGRLIHEKDYSLVDFNRAGIPLMELVTEPDIKSAKEARKFSQRLQLILRYLKVSDADMEKGQMRVEANISLKKGKKLGTKVEIKNLNSFRVVERALDYEIERQGKVLASGKKVLHETRGWNDRDEVTLSQREKEQDHDYRYFPEPDLPPLSLSKDYINKIKAEIPELPQSRRERFAREYKLDEKSIEVFVVNKSLGEYFEKVISELKNWVKAVELKTKISQAEEKKLIKLASNYILTDLQGLLVGALGKDFLITPEDFAEFIALIYEGKISSKIAKQVLSEMFKTGADPSHIIKEKNLSLITNESEIEKIVKEVIVKNQKAVEDFKKGKENALQFLVGQVMARSKGRANPESVRQILLKDLK
ncbi:MAG: Asp-tRNA(Asn)/Glu-tRNA(Gln) amidotransferase GatCAB subunit B [Parcubacteria group bacterium]|nr:Asp-tRNA(Asn)/Glu-tRNA(Gln) amidotransferase GatCAB subunit B [Parcubacteria group bacterium]|tara:strand:- start:48643 stop:50100 length:1458 start_codon:yes stop_codon:yes gene_type:complete